jgi:hypothetical protein
MCISDDPEVLGGLVAGKTLRFWEV